MKKIWIAIGVTILLSLASVTAVMAQSEDDVCGGSSFGGQCQGSEWGYGENTTITSGSTTVHDYHEEWGGYLSTTIVDGYYQPQMGEAGVSFKWGCDPYNRGTQCPRTAAAKWGASWSALSCATWGDVIGYEVRWDGTDWVPTYWTDYIRITNKDQCEYRGGYWNPTWHRCQKSLYDYEELEETVEVLNEAGKFTQACLYNKTDGAHWFDSWDEYTIIPFETISIVPYGNITFWTHFWGTSVTIPYPCAMVKRTPYPRAIVGEPVTFEILLETIEVSSEPIDTCTPDIMDYQIHIRLRPDTNSEPIWYFDEREWGGPTIGTGWTISHIFETSSVAEPAGSKCYTIGPECPKPAIGPSMEGPQLGLDSYKVDATVAYIVEVKRTWRDFYGNLHDTGWVAVDLRQWGATTSQLVITGTRDTSDAPPGMVIPAYDHGYCIVPVPVLESQSIHSTD